MNPVYRKRYQGPRWAVSAGRHVGPQGFALEELHRRLQRLMPYVMTVALSADEAVLASLPDEDGLVMLGTPGGHAALARALSADGVALPTEPESFVIHTPPAPAGQGRRIVIAGADDRGVLYGVMQFCERWLAARQGHIYAEADLPRWLDALPVGTWRETPAIERRGLWSWGYVIYDYERYLDQMARLCMNTLVVWNDHVPVNAAQVISHAHDRGVDVIWGFHWGWGMADLDLADDTHRQRVKEHVLRTYETQYAPLSPDGIYCQSLTEHGQTVMAGRPTAHWVRLWIDDICAALLARHPKLRIHLGVHATSIAEHYPLLTDGLDPRLSIIWEDAGTMPYAASPSLTFGPDSPQARMGWTTFDATLAHSLKLAQAAGPAGFGLCPKGWAMLDWPNQFEHHGSFLLGRRDEGWMRQRLDRLADWWAHLNAVWPAYEARAADFYRQTRQRSQGPMTVVGLVEDGLLELQVQPCVATLARMLWNPDNPGGSLDVPVPASRVAADAADAADDVTLGR